MYKSKRAVSVITALLALFVIAVIHIKPVQAQAVPGDMIHLINRSKVKLSFELSSDGEKWNKFELKSNDSKFYSSTRYIRISTSSEKGTIVRQYRTNSMQNEEARRYYLAWNKNAKCWDVFLLTPKD